MSRSVEVFLLWFHFKRRREGFLSVSGFQKAIHPYIQQTSFSISQAAKRKHWRAKRSQHRYANMREVRKRTKEKERSQAIHRQTPAEIFTSKLCKNAFEGEINGRSSAFSKE
mmetsp:Transcript_30985/g.61092  ORF Transcript_30985/g.61092 Transcript_30985/m.61092 type:complete len:112 (-) Transcript_30985:108-443(-)